MNKPVVIKQTTAVATHKPWPNQNEIKSVASRLDRIVLHNAKFETLLRQNPEWQNLAALESAVNEYEVSGCRWMVSRIGDDVAKLDPDEWWDDDGNIQKSAVSKVLALLVGSFPTSNLPDAAVFTRVMLDDVMATDPHFVVLESACRKLRQSQKFMPSISEILDAVKAEGSAWERRWSALDCIEDSCAEVEKRLTSERERRAAEQAKRPSPFAVGDQVHHVKFGSGIVKEIREKDIDVLFASGQRRALVPSFLDRGAPE